MNANERKYELVSSAGAFILSYTLLALNVVFEIDFEYLFFDSGTYFLICVWCIMLPTLIVKILSNFRVRYTFLSLVITFIMTLIFFPNGWYFIILIGGFIVHTDLGLLGNMLVVIMMFVMQLLAFGLGAFTRYIINAFAKLKLR